LGYSATFHIFHYFHSTSSLFSAELINELIDKWAQLDGRGIEPPRHFWHQSIKLASAKR
jgi:hypothetical protein